MYACIKFICSSGEQVHKMERLKFYRLLYWFISGGCQVYVLVLMLSNSLKTAKIE